MSNRRSSPGGLDAYRRRQERFERMLPFFWIGVMLLVLGAGYLLYRYLAPDDPTRIASLTETSAPTEPTVEAIATTPAPEPTDTLLPADTATSAPTDTPAGPVVISYTVQTGDTLASIAAQFSMGLPTLTALNPEVTPEFLNIGDQLSVLSQVDPGPTISPGGAEAGSIIEYQVQAGDTLAAIALQYGSTVDAIVQENNLASPDQIQEGQTLRIPVAPGTTPQPTSAQPPATIPAATGEAVLPTETVPAPTTAP